MLPASEIQLHRECGSSPEHSCANGTVCDIFGRCSEYIQPLPLLAVHPCGFRLEKSHSFVCFFVFFHTHFCCCCCCCIDQSVVGKRKSKELIVGLNKNLFKTKSRYNEWSLIVIRFRSGRP